MFPYLKVRLCNFWKKKSQSLNLLKRVGIWIHCHLYLLYFSLSGGRVWCWCSCMLDTSLSWSEFSRSSKCTKSIKNKSTCYIINNNLSLFKYLYWCIDMKAAFYCCNWSRWVDDFLIFFFSNFRSFVKYRSFSNKPC